MNEGSSAPTGPTVDRSVRFPLLQLLALLAVAVAMKFAMLLLYLPESENFFGRLEWGETFFLMRCCTYQTLTVFFCVGLIFCLSMGLVLRFWPRGATLFGMLWGLLFFLLSSYHVLTFLYWRHSFCYPARGEFLQTLNIRSWLPAPEHLIDDRAFSSIVLLFALTHVAGAYIAIRSKRPFDADQIRTFVTLAALTAVFAFTGWTTASVPLPAFLVQSPFLALLIPRSDAPVTVVDPVPRVATPVPIATLKVPQTSSVLTVPDSKRSRAWSSLDHRPNVVVVVWESAPAYVVEPVRGDRSHDLLALWRRRMIFDNVYATCPISFSSRFAFLFGDYPPRESVNWGVRRSTFSIPVLMQEAGYAVAAIGSNNLRYGGSYQLLEQAGFERVEGPTEFGQAYLWHMWGVDDRMPFDRARESLRREVSRPSFLTLYLSSSHEPYQSPLPGEKEVCADQNLRYHKAMEFDARLILSFAEWLEKNSGRDWLMLVVGDHGESLGQRGRHGHGTSLYEEELHVGCELLYGAGQNLRERVGVIGSMIDLGPTVLDLCGIEPDPRLAGVSLLSPKASSMAISYMPAGPSRYALRNDRYSLITDTERTSELYDLEADPDELHDIAKDHQDVVETYRLYLQNWLRRQNPRWQNWLR